LTGSRNVPPSGFPADAVPAIYFDDVKTGLPEVSTCGFTLWFPINFTDKEKEFKAKMDLAILGSIQNFLRP